LEDAVPGPVAPPADEAVIDRFPGAVALGNIAPLRADMQFPEQAIEDAAMIGPGPTGPTGGRKAWIQPRKLVIP